MKYVLMALALLALIGSAAAWDETIVAKYSLAKSTYAQNEWLDLSGTASGVYFKEPTDPTTGSASGIIENVVKSITPNFYDPANPGVTEQTLLQAGKITIVKEAQDSEDADPEVSILIEKSQDYLFSGQFYDPTKTETKNGVTSVVSTGPAMSVEFSDEAVAGVNYDPALEPEISSCGNFHVTQDTDSFVGTISVGPNGQLSEGAVGVSTWTGADVDGWLGDIAMNGGISGYSEFFGATIPGGQNQPITTTITGSNQHAWNAGIGYWDDVDPLPGT